MDLTGILIPLGSFAAVSLSLYYYLKARNKERMALIEQGLYNKQPEKKSGYTGIKAGSFLVAVSIGIFLGYVLGTYTGIDEVVSYFSMILLFGGASLILTNIIVSKKEQENK